MTSVHYSTEAVDITCTLTGLCLWNSLSTIQYQL